MGGSLLGAVEVAGRGEGWGWVELTLGRVSPSQLLISYFRSILVANRRLVGTLVRSCRSALSLESCPPPTPSSSPLPQCTTLSPGLEARSPTFAPFYPKLLLLGTSQSVPILV